MTKRLKVSQTEEAPHAEAEEYEEEAPYAEEVEVPKDEPEEEEQYLSPAKKQKTVGVKEREEALYRREQEVEAVEAALDLRCRELASRERDYLRRLAQLKADELRVKRDKESLQEKHQRMVEFMNDHIKRSAQTLSSS